MVLMFIVLSIMDIAGLVIISQYISFIVDPSQTLERLNSIVDISQYNSVYFFGGLVSIVFFVKFLFGIFINKVILDYCFNNSVDIQKRLMEAYQSIPYNVFLRRNSAEYIQIINKQAIHFTQVTLQFAIRIVSEGIVAIAILSFLAVYNFTSFVIIFPVVTLIIFFYIRTFKDRLVSYGNIVHEESNALLKTTQETFDNYKEINIIGKEDLFIQKLCKSASNFANAYVKSSLISTSPRYFAELIMVLIITMIFLVFNYMNLGADYIVSTLGVIAISFVRLVPIINIITGGISQVKFGIPSALIIYDDLKRSEKYKRNYKHNKNRNKKDIYFKSIKFLNVSYRYDKMSEFILSNVNVEIKKGDFVGVIGPSGSGKTTFIDILIGFLKPAKGEVLYNDHPLNENLLDWKSQLYYMSQNGVLLDDTIMANVSLSGEGDIDENFAIKIIEMVGLKKWIDSLPSGVSTRVGKDGVKISGGQRQRISLARAIYSKKKILVLDEPTSSLDNKTEDDIMRVIIEELTGHTIIVIAHRLRTLRYSNKILKVENGNIKNIGNYESLLKLEEGVS
jgi:ATP-binding cassette, subfamily B, bacterial PglK